MRLDFKQLLAKVGGTRFCKSVPEGGKRKLFLTNTSWFAAAAGTEIFAQT